MHFNTFFSKKVVQSLLMKHIKISHPKEMSEDLSKNRQRKEIKRQNEVIEISDQSHGNTKIPSVRNNSGMGFSCKYCDKTFANEITRIRHFKMEHANKAAINPHIPTQKTENQRGKVSKNANSRKQSPKGYPCTRCKKKFETLGDMTKHLKESHSNAKDSNAIIANAMSKFPGISISRTPAAERKIPNPSSIAAAISKLPGITIVKSNDNAKFAKVPDAGRVTISKASTEKSNRSKTYQTIKINNQKQNSKEVFACVFCDKQFNSEKARLHHSETVHFIKGTTKSSNSQTPKSQSKNQGFGCDFCKTNFSTKQNLMNHLKVAHTDSVVHSRKAMPFDGKNFQNKNNTNLTCRFCNRRFNKPNNLDIHLRYQHRDDTLREQSEKQKLDQDGMIKCSFCDKVFPKKGIDLYRHNLTEHKDAMEKSAKNKHQGKNFTMKRNLLPVG